MTEEHKGLPVAGYQPQSDDNVKLVNSNKEMEERLLRVVDGLQKRGTWKDSATGETSGQFDSRWLSIAQTHFEQGFMALNRAIFQPSRINLPEDNGQPQS